MAILILALLIGIVAGLHTMTAMAAASWAAHLGRLGAGGTWLAILGSSWTVWILTLLALVEFVTDQLPSTASRTVPMQFSARIVTGAISGAAIGASAGRLIAGLVVGTVGTVIGTLGGHAARAQLAARFESDRLAAFLEDAVAIVASCLIVGALP